MNIIRRNILLATAAGLALAGQAAFANSALFEYAFNIGGNLWDSLNLDGTLNTDPLPGGVDISSFDTTTGLGSITVTLTGADSHYVSVFVDHEVDETTNTFFNENGSTSGSAAAGQSWEIDEPGYGSTKDGSEGTAYYGDIVANFSNSSLDNQIFYDAVDGQTLTPPDDVSMAMGWSFSDPATLTFLLSTTKPTSGFYLTQTDAASGNSIYFSSTIESSVVPLPAAGWLFGSVMAGAVALGRRRRADRAA